MCGPVAILAVSALLSAAATGVSYYSQQQAANTQQKYQNEMLARQTVAANKAYNDQLDQINIQKDQQNLANFQQEQNVLSDIRQQRSTAATMLADGNMGGSGVAATMQQYAMMESQAKMNAMSNQQFQDLQRQYDRMAAQAQAQSRIYGSMSAPVNQPSALAAGLSMGAIGVGAYDTYEYRSGGWDRMNAGRSQYRGPTTRPIN